ncbi:MAG: peptide chain release factor N(5)-glutamine methyltransferase [Wenzhouxiangellaceae bacterium]|nr:peptide chain release factor N(5)-glutamine methyltransferase [Wenzhouxiangellaceae bacterium]
MRNRRAQANATALRRQMTDAECRLWHRLRKRQLHGYKFRRQHTVGPFIADFACIEAGLIVEVDGGQHSEQRAEDEARTRFLRSRGFKVLRFWNNEVLKETDVVLEVISQALCPHPNPPPQAGEGDHSIDETASPNAGKKKTAAGRGGVPDGQASNGGDSLGELLTRAAARLESRREAEILLGLALGRPRAWLLAHGDAKVGPADGARFEALVDRRAGGTPIAYLTGLREFYGREFLVDENVLIPRPETEHLVEFALGLGLPEDARVADIGTGSGCIILTLAAERPGWHCVGTEISHAALKVAADNRDSLGLDRVELLAGDLLDPLESREFELIVSNPPYVAEGDPHLARGDVRFEPAIALATAGDGLTVLRQLIEQAPARLVPAGWLAVEHGYDQAEAVRGMFTAAGYSQVRSIPDLAGIERVTVGKV